MSWMRARSSSSLTRIPSRAAAWTIIVSLTSSFITCWVTPSRSTSSGVSFCRVIRSYWSMRLACVRRKRSAGMSSPLTVATTLGLLPPPLLLFPVPK